MTDHTFQPVNAAVRRISSGEGDALRGFLASDLGLDAYLESQGIDPIVAAQAASDTGITLPDRGLGDKFTSDDLKLYTDVLQGSQSFFDASESFGFNSESAITALQNNNLRVPLQSENRGVFDLASEFGFTSTDVSRELGIEKNAIDTTLAAAGLSLPGRAFKTNAQNPSQTASGDPTRASNEDLLSGAFNGVPQAPGVKLGFLKKRSNKNPNIKSGPRGVTESGAIRQNTLLAGI